MRGTHISRPSGDILAEVGLLAESGVKEIVVIGQDTTMYGVDFDGKRHLPGLLRDIADIPGIAWVRLMYAYPAHFPEAILDVMASHPRICKYLDLPVQHAADAVLKSMRRGMSRRALLDLVRTIRERVPGVALRTTLIVGYPAEGEAEFEELLDFVRQTRFDRLGVFTYSLEEGTTAFPLGDPVPAEEKERRRAAVMEVQREISEAQNEDLVGRRVRVLVDRLENGQYFGRTEHDAPEIDNEVILPGVPDLRIGSFYDVGIVEAYEYDIHGKVLA
jgi:ribosomal protein S12 methylthiotransferase